MLEQLQEIFWTDWVWLASNKTWHDLQNRPGRTRKAQVSDLWLSLVAGVVLLLLRFTIEILLLRPLAKRLLLATSCKRRVKLSEQQQRQLEAAFQQQGAAAAAASLNDSDAAGRNWLRERHNLSKKSIKFAEAAWQMLYYSCAVAYGIWLLHREIYVFNTQHLWLNWPEHEASTGTQWYYIIQLGYYYSALLTICRDTKRKDSMQMAVHHLVTIYLMNFSYAINMIRVGNVILLLHDLADPLLNAAKIGNYLQTRSISDTSFAAFAAIWVVTRLIYYPLFVLRSCLFELPIIIGWSPALVSLTLSLIILQVLHIVWTYFISLITLRVLLKGHRSDSRSDSEGSDDDDDNLNNGYSTKLKQK